jgi:hypothetical protein
MAIKFNKEEILKHRFWVMIGVTACLTFTGIFYLQFAVDADPYVATIKKGLAANGKTKGANSAQTIDAMSKDVEKAKKLESEVWSASYTKQASLFKWAPRVEAEYDFLKGKFATDIKISKAADAKDWPKDTETLVHGIFDDRQTDYLTIKNAKNESVKFFRMDTGMLKITNTEDSKAVNWDDLNAHKKKLLAVSFQRGKYFADGLTNTERNLFQQTYRDQIQSVLRTVNPLDEKGNGVVQLRGWLYDKEKLPHETIKDGSKFIRYVTDDWELNKNFSKEAWIAQENIWIQQEIYNIIKAANDDLSVFKPEGAEHAKKAKGWGEKRNQGYTFKNAYFSVELTLKKDDSLVFKIKNLQKRRQKLDLNFSVKVNNGEGFEPEILPISGPPLAPNQEHSQTFEFAKEGKLAKRNGIYSVEQVLTWETAAVKRIDHISIGSNDPSEFAHSQRTFPLGLRPFDDKDIVKADDPKMGKMGGERPINPPIGVGQVGPGGGAGANKTPLLMGLWTDRYVEVSEQSRRVPVAVALIVDQDHIDRVMTAFNNSRLRFLESLVLVNHYTGSLQPPLPDAAKDNMGLPPRPAFPGGGPRGGIMGQPQQPVAGAGGGDLETNMEMVIYGVMTLYQRYPPPPARPAADKKQ